MKLMIMKECMMYERDDKKRPHGDEDVRSGWYLPFPQKKNNCSPYYKERDSKYRWYQFGVYIIEETKNTICCHVSPHFLIR